LSDPGSADEIAGQLSALRSRADVRRRMLGAAGRDIAGRAPVVLAAQAAELVERAASREREAAGLDADAGPLLEALRRLQGVDFGPAPVESEMNGRFGSVAPLTRSESMRAEAGNMSLVAGVLKEVAAGGPVSDFAGPRQITGLLPSSLKGPAALVPDAGLSAAAPAAVAG
jgi:hypothetical protein